ncbi:ppsA [Symbiodinium sp. CCMP2456]|nr:ppsA [Symbiodinium sp. CCMP2456]
MRAWMQRRCFSTKLFMTRLGPLLGKTSSRWWQRLERNSVTASRGQYGASEISSFALRLEWEVLGPEVGPIQTVVTPRGQLSRDAARPLASAIAERGKRVLLWDRRCTGSSSAWASWEESLPEQEVQDLACLLDSLAQREKTSTPVSLVGLSSGARLSALFAARHPQRVLSLVLLPTGDFYGAASILGRAYYGDCADTAEAGGMEALVAAEGSHFQALAKNSSRARDELLGADPKDFILAMRRSQAFLDGFKGSNLLGLQASELAGLQRPALVLHHGLEDDRLHALEDAIALSEQLSSGRLLVEPDAGKCKEAVADFVNQT